MAEIKKRWYVVRAVGGKEKKVRESMLMEIKRQNIEHLIGDVLVPTEKVYQIRNGKKVSKEKNFFPGYILIEASLQGEVIHIIKSVPDVMGFMSGTKGGDPMPLRVNEVNRILGKVDEMSEQEEEMNVPYVVGETIKVIDGPFNGFTGVIEDINEEKKKLEVMVKIFGRKTPLELNYMQVEKE
ncbi:transcription termination/antitermination factor NusG [Putridiphycobacter roseus]|uniref:Transcription termination/antitermination protein NusG n=1 Tax=Putridiphycobacter roseus TaxID=2219161 RepID=A0A2W1NMP1_9FLAO|nr:transcription termination/antitermination protein NusG [Putridiphycobacter roseus]PZE16932.1 transcription termination/antitermination factor NusG [Putridiphycobacter roseus]